MELDLRYYSRRAAEEALAASRAITAAARERRQNLADTYMRKVMELRAN